MMLSSSRIVAVAVGRSQTPTSRLFSIGATKATTSSMTLSSSRVASAALGRSRLLARRWLSESKSGAKETVVKETAAKEAVKEAPKDASKEGTGLWHSAKFWGGLGALAGWGMSGAALYDATLGGPEVISLTMTPVLIVYSALFARWAFVVKPQNLLLASCHITNVLAQSNQLRRALEYKINNGQEEEVMAMGQKAALGGAAIAGSVLAGPTIRAYLSNANLGIVSSIAAADAGPFTVHFWAPMSKWMISGASFMDLYRPTDQISLAQYTALTLTGLFFSRYALLVAPINYTLCSVNIALFGSSAWHLSRKINADYLHLGQEEEKKKD